MASRYRKRIPPQIGGIIADAERTLANINTGSIDPMDDSLAWLLEVPGAGDFLSSLNGVKASVSISGGATTLLDAIDGDDVAVPPPFDPATMISGAVELPVPQDLPTMEALFTEADVQVPPTGEVATEADVDAVEEVIVAKDGSETNTELEHTYDGEVLGLLLDEDGSEVGALIKDSRPELNREGDPFDFGNALVDFFFPKESASSSEEPEEEIVIKDPLDELAAPEGDPVFLGGEDLVISNRSSDLDEPANEVPSTEIDSGPEPELAVVLEPEVAEVENVDPVSVEAEALEFSELPLDEGQSEPARFVFQDGKWLRNDGVYFNDRLIRIGNFGLVEPDPELAEFIRNTYPTSPEVNYPELAPIVETVAETPAPVLAPVLSASPEPVLTPAPSAPVTPTVTPIAYGDHGNFTVEPLRHRGGILNPRNWGKKKIAPIKVDSSVPMMSAAEAQIAVEASSPIPASEVSTRTPLFGPGANGAKFARETPSVEASKVDPIGKALIDNFPLV